MAGSSLFINFARVAKVVALLLFLLPWVTVSCSPNALNEAQAEAGATAPRLTSPALSAGVPIANASGLNMATGQLTMQLPPMGPEANRGQARTEPPPVPVEIGVIAGAAFILLALLASFLLKGAAGAMAAIGGSVLAMAALCYSVFVSYPSSVVTTLAANNQTGARGGSAPTPEQVAQILDVKVEIGFYMVLLALALAILFNALALRKPGPAAEGTPPPAAG